MNFLRTILKKILDKSDSLVDSSKQDDETSNKTSSNIEKEAGELLYFIENLKKTNHYIPRSEYLDTINQYKDFVARIDSLKQSDILEEYCNKNNIKVEEINNLLEIYNNITDYVDKINDKYISDELVKEKEYLDNILKDVDPKIILDENQRKVVLCDEDYSLVVAGAGAGKTTTVAARVKYLVEKKKIDPKTILVISFTNKAVQELKKHINKELNIDCPIATFHSTGNAILKKQTTEDRIIVDDSKLYYVLQDYFRNSILKNKSLINNLILFFSTYFDSPLEGNDLTLFFNKIAKSTYSTMKSELENYEKVIIDSRTKQKKTIRNEIVRSKEEVEIANFLYLNNIEYEYEPLYKYNITYSKKPYTPDFIIKQGNNECYIEHFGITEDGKNNRYSRDQLNFYKKSINDKINLHKKHNTRLIYTFSKYNDGKSIREHLEKLLVENGFILNKKTDEEVMEKIITNEENKYIRKLINLITRFISNFKTNGFGVDEFNRMYHQTTNERTKLFLTICHECYLEYDRYLKENNAVDFQDMINESARILREVKEVGEKLDFNYIIVDEYQDISRQRFNLVKELSNVTNAKIMAVGDDWQAIYAFSGSDITLFTKFEQIMGYAKLLKIVNTYRNSQDIIDIAGNFIQKNTAQIKKSLISPKRIIDPVIIYTYDETYKKGNDINTKGNFYALSRAIETAIEQIIEYSKQENKTDPGSILLIGRFGFDADKLEKAGLFEFVARTNKIKSIHYPKLNITFMTAHASKGLGYDNVIVINGINGTYGFPSKIEDDPVLSFVIKGDKSINYAEERRLFYVAMTRTKNRVYFVAPEKNPSEFLIELKQEYKNVALKGIWNENGIQERKFNKVCPICGYPLQYRYKNSYGLPLFICTNEPEICGFMTNEYSGGKLSITKCDKCLDGYLIVKHRTEDNSYFLGCTNWKSDGSGCNNTMGKLEFYSMNKYEEEKNQFPIEPIKGKKQSTVKEEAIKKTKEIREKTIIKPYINEKLDDKLKTANKIVYAILQCLSDISFNYFYGVEILIDVLRGGESKKIKERKLNELPLYGKLNNIPRDKIKAIIMYLIENKYILQTNHKLYPVLHPTYEGIHYSETITPTKLKDIYNELIEEEII